MNKLRLWAPRTETALALVEGQKIEMVKSGGGWWETPSEPAKHGTSYKFSVNGRDFFPDPASRWQPEGVHGASRYVDHSLFQWTDSNWQCPPLGSAVIYEMHVGTFSEEGTFDGAIQHLDYLVDIGITHLEIMPVNSFAGRHGWGYDGVALYSPHEPYGGPEGLKKLVDKCHSKGLTVILDVVYNHLGPEGNYLGNFAPYFSDKYASPWGEGINLDGPYSDEVRSFFIENALMWLRDYHMDGLRLDAVHAFVDMSATHFLEELSDAVRRLEVSSGCRHFLIAESDLNDPRVIRPADIGGYGIDAQWSDDLHHSLHALITGERQDYYSDFGKISQVAKALKNSFVYDGTYSPFRKRKHGRTPQGLPGYSFVASLQNHDQVGNRGFGERINHLCDPLLQMAASALIFTSPFIPMIFQGEEWACSSPFYYFTDFGDEELAEMVREGRKKEFASLKDREKDIPDPNAENTFNSSRLNWNERDQRPHSEMLSWYRNLINLRKENFSLHDGDRENTTVRFSDREGWIVLERKGIVTACNFSTEERTIELEQACSKGEVLLKSHDDLRLLEGSLVLPPFCTCIIKK
jgi:maltooligosyltrehalose trehalohydrolase